MSFTTVLFYLLSLVLVFAAFRVILSRSPVTAVLHLILVFFTASMLWMIQEAEFLSLILVVVYVGAVMVMFLFVVMMLDMRSETVKKGFRTHLPLGLTIGVIMVLEMGFVLARVWFDAPRGAPLPADYNNTFVLGVAMYTEYAFAVQVGGVVLLVGMISAIALTLRKRTDVKYNDPAKQVRVRAKDRFRMVNIPSQSEVSAPSAKNEGNA